MRLFNLFWWNIQANSTTNPVAYIKWTYSGRKKLKKSASMMHWKGFLALSMISICLTKPTYSEKCAVDVFGFIYTCCAQYKCPAGVGQKCSINAPPGSQGRISGYETVDNAKTGQSRPLWSKAATCAASPGWQQVNSGVCTMPSGWSLIDCWFFMLFWFIPHNVGYISTRQISRLW